MRKPFDFKLNASDAHLWRVFLPGLQSHGGEFSRLLSPEQAERSQRFVDPARRTQYAIRMAMLKLLLGRYTNTDPFKIKFGLSDFGKPHVLEHAKGTSLEFNVSHSGDWLFVAITENHPVGVDVECVKPDFPVIEISNRFFTVEEASLVARADENCRAKTFFKIWVRKEAYLKAIGKGLNLSLDSFNIPRDLLTSLENPEDNICRLVGDIDKVWYFFEVASDPQYCSCLVSDFIPSKITLLDIFSSRDFEVYRIVT